LTRRLRSNWADAVLVCGKCTKKLKGGFGRKGRTPLAKALRKHLGLKKGRKGRLGVVEVRCLGVCPKDAVTVVAGAAAKEWLIVPAGTEISEIVHQIGIVPDTEPA
jgi:predicted metal-binding protein